MLMDTKEVHRVMLALLIGTLITSVKPMKPDHINTRRMTPMDANEGQLSFGRQGINLMKVDRQNYRRSNQSKEFGKMKLALSAEAKENKTHSSTQSEKKGISGGLIIVLTSSRKSNDTNSDMTSQTEGQNQAFFWSWEAVVILCLPVLCVASLLIHGFFTRTRHGVRLFGFLKRSTTYDLEISRRINLNLEVPHVFRGAETLTGEGEAKGKQCVGIELKYNSSKERFDLYYGTMGSVESFAGQYSSKGKSSRDWGNQGGDVRTGSGESSVNTYSRSSSSKSKRASPRIWHVRKDSNDSQTSIDSQFRRWGSMESQRSFMRLWYTSRKGSADSQANSDSHSRRSSSESRGRQTGERRRSLDSGCGSISSQGSKEVQDNGEGRPSQKRKDSPRQLEASLQEVALYSVGSCRNLDVDTERRGARALSLIYEEDKDDLHL